ncbi:MAG: DUF5020 family protein [Bacteroidetes bacterium]|nr:DUF5020 family protein [Bacteroidota bacterium]
MNRNWFFIFCFTCTSAFSQTLQLHYDIRHTIDPKRNTKNYPTLYFEYFKNYDSAKSFIKPGSFLLKMQADFTGKKNNMAQFYMQVSQTFKCWKPDFFLNLQYSGGLGVTDPKQYSFYITNTYSVGIAYPFRFGSAYMSSVLNYKYVAYAKPTNDFLYTLYWWKGLWNYKAEFAGDFSIWTENKNHGDDFTKDLHGKRFFFFAEPQFWYNLSKSFSAGTKLNTYYHVLITDNVLQIYPTIAVRWKL